MTPDTGDELEMDFLRWAGHPGGVWLVQLPRLWMEEGWGLVGGGGSGGGVVGGWLIGPLQIASGPF